MPDGLAELSDVKDGAFEIMQAYAVENKEELFARKKSVESAHGVFGFRTGTPKLKNLKGFTWAAVTNLCKELLPSYIRTSEELAKDKLLADRELPEVAGVLPQDRRAGGAGRDVLCGTQERERCSSAVT